MKKVFRVLGFCFLFILLAVGALGVYAWRQLGAAPSVQELKKYENLPYFQNGHFVSRTDISVHPEKMSGGKSSMLKLFLAGNDVPELPTQQLTSASFGTPEDMAVYWLGHSSLIIELDGKRFLVDPVFGNAAPVPGLFNRYVPSPLKRQDIPPVDYVLITHNHYDHLEAATLRALKDRDALFIVPLGVGAALRSWGIPAARIRELGWDESLQDGTLTVTAGETGHYSNRRPDDRNKTLWVSYILQSGDKKIYISGDSGYDADLYQSIGRKYGPFDLAFIEIDAWNEGWPGIHLFPHQAVQAAQDIGAQEFIPVHWGVFNLGQHPWNESISKVASLAKEQGVKLVSPLMGQKYVPGQTLTRAWWEEVK